MFNFSHNAHFKQGTNTLMVKVHNSELPSGLMVDAKVKYCEHRGNI